ncbi:competence protein CoiA family protein [Gracilibacillus sp. S3-1-1]|uniref:Competence protein CoiA family protein n=1 Tax=Gracilibacillus pellucidus TaxID=3095368 RepID=A0ACC6M4A7_9BACI|nr:competence protein CoiA family protein [Gracilibacillus sp. S3-1-1]MDX8045795.1 competence protein CoiA family protein [Gracilibacillus sp. S3-1-1]
MLQAENEQGDLVPLWQLAREQIKQIKDKNFYCPGCKEKVLIKAGWKNTPHFAHQKQTNCTLSTGEGIYHENGKKDIYVWLKKQGFTVHLEYYLPAIKQRADIYLEVNKKRIAIEYQCATISRNEIMERTNGYRSIGIIPIWILGANKLRRKAASSLHIPSANQAFLHQFHPSFPISLYYYCSDEKKWIIYQDIIFLSKTLTYGVLHVKSLSSTLFQDLFKVRTRNRQSFHSYWHKYKSKWKHRPAPNYYQEETNWRQWLYLHQLTVQSLPTYSYFPITTQFQMKTPPWIWQSKLYVELFLTHDIFTIQEAQYLLQKHYLPAEHFPLIQVNQDPIGEYLQQLVHINILQKVSNISYKVVHTIV